jgi:penicillin-insensitive murein endopeptidase
MQRAQLFILVGSLLAIPAVVNAADPAATRPSPAPVEAKRAAAPMPAPQQKPATPADAKGVPKHADKKDAKDAKKEEKPKILARDLFGKAQNAANLAARSIGWYAKGCLAGGMHLADAGPDWQTMRPSRNRAWGHPKLIALLKRLAAESKKDGWSGLLVGDISQPRGGPMLTGHASHQVGLDADIWLTPMPNRVLTRREREDIQATSMLDKTSLTVDPKIFTPTHVALIKRAASYPQVERVFVHPAIKKALCEAAGKDRAWLYKVRPIWGHYYHFHVRIGCPNGGCETQPPVKTEDGCGPELKSWLKDIEASLKKAKQKTPAQDVPVATTSAKRLLTMEQLPPDCKAVLASGGVPPPPDEAMAATPTAATNQTKQR